MSDIGKVAIDIQYCVPCGYQNLAAWTVSEMFAAVGTDAAISLTPGEAGVYTVAVDGEVWYDKSDQGGTPDIQDMKDLKARLKKHVGSLAPSSV